MMFSKEIMETFKANEFKDKEQTVKNMRISGLILDLTYQVPSSTN